LPGARDRGRRCARAGADDQHVEPTGYAVEAEEGVWEDVVEQIMEGF